MPVEELLPQVGNRGEMLLLSQTGHIFFLDHVLLDEARLQCVLVGLDLAELVLPVVCLLLQLLDLCLLGI